VAPPLAKIYTEKAEAWLSQRSTMLVTAVDVVRDEEETAVGVVVQLTQPDGTQGPVAEVMGGDLVDHMFARAVGLDGAVLEWLDRCDTNIEVLSAFGVCGKVERGGTNTPGRRMSVVGFRPE
jgi:hypothetical protein